MDDKADDESIPSNEIVFIDLPDQKPKDIKALRKGQGPLVEVVLETLEELQAAGIKSQPVVVITSAKSDGSFW
ncbi:hypothetical protein ABAZ39_27185 (plasmid) [Azospirillum argentinense]|uniref:Uncharacterized protein n=1 Tax=Azospirillum argentinense TaxID=2970906 RepID=A0A060DNU4_9PROT|nr:hypothetical protein ABAZ39_27185 [Azospirillum argentinense]PNQ99945.1 hypothetical protein C1S70_06180 [Azospirillum argentinense]